MRASALFSENERPESATVSRRLGF